MKIISYGYDSASTVGHITRKSNFVKRLIGIKEQTRDYKYLSEGQWLDLKTSRKIKSRVLDSAKHLTEF